MMLVVISLVNLTVCGENRAPVSTCLPLLVARAIAHLGHRSRPRVDRPGFLALLSPVVERLVVPHVMNLVQLTNLGEPGANGCVSRLETSLETDAPLVLPFEQGPRLECVASKLKYATLVD